MNTKTNVHQGHKARKRFGQNFLTDCELISHIAASTEPHTQDHIIEIGPGLGALTDELIASGAQITLIELDRDLVVRLTQKYHNTVQDEHLQIISADILKVDLNQILNKYPNRPAKLVGNLPYNISTPVLFHILDQQAHFESMTFMLQKEVVDRMSASPYDSAYSALSIILQLECDITKLFDVPPESFQPPPKVDSAVVQLKQKNTLPIETHQLKMFRAFVHKCFEQRRKTLRNNLKELFHPMHIEAIGIDPLIRPEDLHLHHYVELFEEYEKARQFTH